jgi:hypothetical protein
MDDQQPEKRGPGRPPKQIAVAPRDFDTDSVIARRLAGNPFGGRDMTVPLRDPERWATYEANSLADPNNHYQMVYVKGWVPLRVEDLAPGISPESIGWQVDADGTLCRGPRQDQRLYKMPKELYAQIQQAKTAANLRGTGSAKAVKEALVESASAQLGDEAASFTRSNITVTGSDRVVGA